MRQLAVFVCENKAKAKAVNLFNFIYILFLLFIADGLADFPRVLRLDLHTLKMSCCIFSVYIHTFTLYLQIPSKVYPKYEFVKFFRPIFTLALLVLVCHKMTFFT